MILNPSHQSLMVVPSLDGTQLSYATGFVVLGPLGFVLITNRHVVTGRDNWTDKCLHASGAVPNQLVVRHRIDDVVGQPARFNDRVEALYDNDGSPLWIEHPTLGSKCDCVALELENSSGIGFLPYPGGTPMDAQIPDARICFAPSDPVSVVGFPFGLHTNGLPIWATGFIASEPSTDYANLPTFLIDCRARPGQSGAPVVLQRNGGVVLFENGSIIADGRSYTRFLGIYSGRVNDKSDLGIVWKAHAVRELLAAMPREP